MSIAFRQQGGQRIKQEQRIATRLYQAMDILELPWPALLQRIEAELSDNPVMEKEEEKYIEEGEEGGDEDFRRGIFQAGEGNVWREKDNDPADVGHNLYSELLLALGLSATDEKIRFLGEIIIDSLDESGYLGIEIEELKDIAVSLYNSGKKSFPAIEVRDIKQALEIVQGLGWAGIGARNLQECLLLQLGGDSQEERLARQAVLEGLDELAGHKYEALAKKLDVGLDSVKKIVEIIERLNPRPGSALGGEEAETIVAEMAFGKNKGVWIGEVVSGNGPGIQLSTQYVKMAKKESGANEETREYLKGKIEAARNLMEAIEQRQRTMKMVIMEIARRQEDFLNTGLTALHPMTMEEVASAIGMHKSTISRVCRGRYVSTPFGIWPLRRLFSSGVETEGGEGGSAEGIKIMIGKMVQGEDKSKPWSDEVLKEKLSQAGIKIARRTVAKYREALGVPPAGQRKRL